MTIYREMPDARTEFQNALKLAGVPKHVLTSRTVVVIHTQSHFELWCQSRNLKYFQSELKTAEKIAYYKEQKLPEISLNSLLDGDLLETSMPGIYVSNSEHFCDAFYQRYIAADSLTAVQQTFEKILANRLTQCFPTSEDEYDQNLLVHLTNPLDYRQYNALNNEIKRALMPIPRHGQNMYTVQRTKCFLRGSEFPTLILRPHKCK